MKLLSLILNWKKLVSLIKLLEHVKFGEATATSHSVVKEQLIISDTYYSLGYSSNYHTFLIFRKWPQSKRWSSKKLPKLLPVHQMSEVSLLNTKGKQTLCILVEFWDFSKFSLNSDLDKSHLISCLCWVRFGDFRTTIFCYKMKDCEKNCLSAIF